jgi:hypothetical protein
MCKPNISIFLFFNKVHNIRLTPCCQWLQNLQCTIKPLSTPIPHTQRMPCSRTSVGVTSTPDKASKVEPDAGERKRKASN